MFVAAFGKCQRWIRLGLSQSSIGHGGELLRGISFHRRSCRYRIQRGKVKHKICQFARSTGIIDQGREEEGIGSSRKE